MSKTAAEIEQDIFRSLEASRNYVEQAIQAEIDTWQGPPNLIEAMKYAVMSGGKRIRPVLAIEIARLIGGEAVVQRTHSAACADRKSVVYRNSDEISNSNGVVNKNMQS